MALGREGFEELSSKGKRMQRNITLDIAFVYYRQLKTNKQTKRNKYVPAFAKRE